MNYDTWMKSKVAESAPEGFRQSLSSAMLPINKREHLWLFSPYQDDEKKDAERFATAFAGLWDEWPKASRRTLVKYWGQDTMLEAILASWSPNVKLIQFLSNSSTYNPRDIGTCRLNGHAFEFLFPIVRLMPERIQKILISHELVHALLYAIDDVMKEDEDICREANCDLGYDEDELDKWLYQNKDAIK